MALADLDGARRAAAMERWQVLRPHLEEAVPLATAAQEAGVPLRTAQRWLTRYRADGLAGLARQPRADRGRRRLPEEMVALVEGLALRRPPPSLASVHREVSGVADRKGWPRPCYASVYAIATSLDPALVTLAHEGDKAYQQAYDLIYRREAERPNAIWQADHTELDLLVLDPPGPPARPWLSAILDDHSRAVPGYALNLSPPSALQTALALRQGIWRKADPAWHVCGIPEVLYSDHGADFTSHHMGQVCVDLHVQLVHSAPGKPRGRGKVERLFSTINQLFLPGLPGHLMSGKLASPPGMTLAQLDAALHRFIVGDYHQRPHGETGQAPQERWDAGGFLPRLPERLEDLDLLLLTVARPRKVHPDGIHLHSLRYLDPTLAGYVGEEVTVRYDPRDLSEVRVFHDHGFLCRAICPELAEVTVTLKEITQARAERRRHLKGRLANRSAIVDQLLAVHRAPATPARPRASPAPKSTLKRYRNE